MINFEVMEQFFEAVSIFVDETLSSLEVRDWFFALTKNTWYLSYGYWEV